MARIYRCDGCGKEVSAASLLNELKFNVPKLATCKVIGEYCDECMAKIEACIKEGVNLLQKTLEH